MRKTELSKVLKALRIKCGMTQREIAARMKVTQAYISQLENGSRYATESFIKFFCIEFNADLKMLEE